MHALRSRRGDACGRRKTEQRKEHMCAHTWTHACTCILIHRYAQACVHTQTWDWQLWKKIQKNFRFELLALIEWEGLIYCNGKSDLGCRYVQLHSSPLIALEPLFYDLFLIRLYVCMRVCRCPLRPEEGIKPPEAGTPHSPEPTEVDAGPKLGFSERTAKA